MLSLYIVRRVSLILLALRGGGYGAEQNQLTSSNILQLPGKSPSLPVKILQHSVLEEFQNELESCDFALLANDCAQAFHARFDIQQWSQRPAQKRLAEALADLVRSGENVNRSDGELGGIEVAVLRRGCHRCLAESGGGFFGRSPRLRVSSYALILGR